MTGEYKEPSQLKTNKDIAVILHHIKLKNSHTINERELPLNFLVFHTIVDTILAVRYLFCRFPPHKPCQQVRPPTSMKAKGPALSASL